MTYYLEKWDEEKRKWVILKKSTKKIDPKKYNGTFSFQDNDVVVITKRAFGIKYVVKRYNYLSGHFSKSTLKTNWDLAYRSAAGSHYHFVHAWALFKRVPKMLTRVLSIIMLPTMAVMMMWFFTQNIPLLVAMWAAMVSMMTAMLTKN